MIESGTSREPDRDAAVHEEVNRLPEKYRAAIVLCDLEGRTHREAARFLGWPIGTVKSRQSQGRELIRHRLLRRGFGLAVVGGVAESLRQSVVAAVPKETSRNTVTAAMWQSAHVLTGLGASAHVLTLTQGVLRAMFWIRLRFLTLAILVAAIASGGVSVYVCRSQEPAAKDKQTVSNRPSDPTPQTAQPKTSDTSRGNPASTASQVKLRAQQLAAQKARISYEIARLTRELAEIAVKEYEEVSFPQDVAAVEDEIKLAESDLSRSADRLDWARRMFDKKYISPATKSAEELNNKKAHFALEQVQSKRKVLVDYTKSKTIRERQSEVEKARADEQAKAASWDWEKAKEAELERLLGLDRH
jgi:hypothetical protein